MRYKLNKNYIVCVVIIMFLFIGANYLRNHMLKNQMVYVEEPPMTVEELKKQAESEVESVEIVEETSKNENIDVWISTTLNIREKPNTDSDIIGMYYQGAKLNVTYIDDEWAKITDTKYYVHRDYLSETKVEKKKIERISYGNYNVPSNNTIKSYMDYRAITNTRSKQYKLQKVAYTGNHGIRMVDDRYCVALGSYYTTTIGQYVDIVLENGNVIKGILADCKADRHTDAKNQMHPDGSVVEMVVDTGSLDNMARRMGDCSYVDGWNSKVINIKVYDKVKDF